MKPLPRLTATATAAKAISERSKALGDLLARYRALSSSERQQFQAAIKRESSYRPAKAR